MGPPGQKPVLCTMSHVQMLYTQKGESFRMNISSLLPFGAVAALTGQLNKQDLVLVTIPESRYIMLCSAEKQNAYLIEKINKLQKRKKKRNQRGKQ